MSDGKLDPRKAFAGDDPAVQLRRMAKHMYDGAMRNAEEARRQALRHQYTSAPYLEVVVSQVRADPPLWRMESVTPVVEDAYLRVEEADQRHLEPELRMEAARLLLHFGHVQTWDEARERVKLMEIKRQGRIVMPRDSERHLFERRR